MERVMGIEPTLAAWEAAVLPLNYTRLPAPDFICVYDRSASANPGLMTGGTTVITDHEARDVHGLEIR
jgi:hypothetical protein